MVAREIIEKIRDHSKGLVEEAELLSKELVSVSMPWTVIWYEAIENIMNTWRRIQHTATIRRGSKNSFYRKLYFFFEFLQVQSKLQLSDRSIFSFPTKCLSIRVV